MIVMFKAGCINKSKVFETFQNTAKLLFLEYFMHEEQLKFMVIQNLKEYKYPFER